MTDGGQVRSAARVAGFGAVGLVFGGLLGGVIASAVDHCGPGSGNPDADICYDGLAYIALGVGLGTLFGLVIGSTPVDQWVTVYPPDDRRTGVARMPEPAALTWRLAPSLHE